MVGVPAVWESSRKGNVAKVNLGSPHMYIPVLARLADSFNFSEVRAATTGGRLRILLSEGAAIMGRFVL